MAQLYKALITDKRTLSDDTFVIELEAPEIAAEARPGNFVMVSPMRDQVNYDPITPRPYSLLAKLFDDQDVATGFSLIIKKFGRGSEAIDTRQTGDHLLINGPLGNHLDINPSAHFLMAAGGTGVAPATFAAQTMERLGVSYTVLYGGLNSEAVFLDELSRYSVAAEAITEDGSLGERGLVTDLLFRHLQNGTEGKHIFACGPWKMMEAAADVAGRHDVPCTCSLERYMACGFGVCLACIYKKTTDEVNHTCCKEGPVVNGMEVDWNG
jgi:dihydroorotate dehydrogenase electron transfer subunit